MMTTKAAGPAPWGSVAAAWARHADYVDARTAHLTEELLDRAGLRPGDRVLELACGPGGGGLAAAERVAPDGEVVLSDVAPEMLEVAAERARARGIGNVRTLTLDLDDIDEPDASYDVVLSREGLMFASDYVQTARAMVRILRPGGRVALSVWGPREHNPWLGILFESVAAELGPAGAAPPAAGGPFSVSDASELRALLETAGLAGVTVTEASVPAVVRTFEEWWERTTSLAARVAALLASLPDDRVEAIRARAEARATAYATADGLELPGKALVASGRKP